MPRALSSFDVRREYDSAQESELDADPWWNSLRSRSLAGGVTRESLSSARSLVAGIAFKVANAEGTAVALYRRHLGKARALLAALEAASRTQLDAA